MGKAFASEFEKIDTVIKYAYEDKGLSTEDCYQKALDYTWGFGVKVDKKKAFFLFMESANKGHLKAVKELAKCLQYGFGTKKDLATAKTLYAVYNQFKLTNKKVTKITKGTNGSRYSRVSLPKGGRSRLGGYHSE